MMARNVNSETGAEINVNSRESPLLLRNFRGVHRPAIRQTRNFRDENFRYRLLKWTALFVSTLFVGSLFNFPGKLDSLLKMMRYKLDQRVKELNQTSRPRLSPQELGIHSSFYRTEFTQLALGDYNRYQQRLVKELVYLLSQQAPVLGMDGLDGPVFKIRMKIGGGLGVGGTLWALSKTNYSYLTSSSTSAGIYMLMISVVLLLLTGVVGFVGVLRHNRPVMGSLIVLLFVSLVFLLVGGIWTYVTTTQTDQLSLERVVNIVRFDYGKDSSKTALLDIVQQSFRCCGSGSFLSWITSSYSLNQSETTLHGDSGSRLRFIVPKSCCIEPASQSCQENRYMASNTTTNQYIYTKGCVQKLQASNTPYGTYALCVSLSIAVLQIIGLVVSFLLFRTFHYLDTIS